MQGGSPEPCRRRPFPAQAGWPHRRARREALRHAFDGDGATRRGLIDKESNPSLREMLTGSWRSGDAVSPFGAFG